MSYNKKLIDSVFNETRNNGCIVDEILTENFKSTVIEINKNVFLEKYKNILYRNEKFKVDPSIDDSCEWSIRQDKIYKEADNFSGKVLWLIWCLFIPFAFMVHWVLFPIGFITGILGAFLSYIWYQNKEMKKLDAEGKFNLSRSYREFFISSVDNFCHKYYEELELYLYTNGGVDTSELRDKATKYIEDYFNNVDYKTKNVIKYISESLIDQ